MLKFPARLVVVPVLAAYGCVVATALGGGAVEGRIAATVGKVPIDIATSKVVANPTDPIAGSASGSTVTVTLVNSSGAPVTGQTVEINPIVKDVHGHIAAVHVAPTSAVTDSNGVATFVVTSSVTAASQLPESGTVSATVTSDGRVQLRRLAPLSFVSGTAVSQTRSAVTVIPAVVMEGASTGASVQVVLRDNAGSPLSHRNIDLTSVAPPPGTSVGSLHATSVTPLPVRIRPALAGTVADGTATFTVTGNTAGTAILEAKDATDNVVLGNVAVEIATPDEPDVARSSISVSPKSVPADGIAKATVTITLLSANGHPLRKSVTLGSVPPIPTLAGAGQQETDAR